MKSSNLLSKKLKEKRSTHEIKLSKTHNDDLPFGQLALLQRICPRCYRNPTPLTGNRNGDHEGHEPGEPHSDAPDGSGQDD